MQRMWQWIFVMVMAASAWAQQYPILPVPGSPHGIFTMMQDSHSALWMGTLDDVVRFDGEHFYSLRQYGFPREIPNSFAEDSDGGIWIATQGTDVSGGTGRGGVYRYQAGRVTKVFSGDGLGVVALAPGIMLAAIGTEIENKPAFGDLVLFRKAKDGWTPAPLNETRANHLTVDHQGNVLFPCPGGWCEIARGQLLDWHGPGSPLGIQKHAGSPLIERVLRDRFGCLWFRAEAFASYQCPADAQPKPIPTSISLYDSSSHLEETSDGSLFMLVRMALGRPGSFQTANVENGVPNDMDTAMVAKDGTIWIGAESGLYRFMYPFQLEYWDKGNGIVTPHSLLCAGKDIFATFYSVLKLGKDRRRWSPLAGSEGLGAALAAGPGDTLFAATRNFMGQLHLGGGLIAKSALPDDHSADASLARTRDGEIWLGRKGINRVMERKSRFTLHPENLPEARVQDMQYDGAHDTLWACDGNDLFFRKDGAWGRITQRDGLLNLVCRAIGIQANGDVWMGYDAKAVSWIENPASGHPIVRNYTQWMDDIAANSPVHFLSVDHRGWLWGGSEVLYVAAPEAAKAGEWLRLDEHDGLSPPSGDGNPFQSAMDGSVWFGTATGIAHFSPKEDFATRFPPPAVFVAGFSHGQSGPTLADAMGQLPRNTNVVAHIGSLQFDRRNALRIRYRLLPGPAAWITSSNLDLSLGKLRWGRHTLQVQARLATGPWSAVAEQSLTVAGPVWLSWPALLLMGTGGAGIGFGARQWKRRQQFNRELTLPDLSAWRMGALSPETEHLVGTTIDGRYEIGHILAIGGFATVARARDLAENGKLCAVKIFRYELADQDWVRYRFEQEVTALERLSHPNIVKTTGHGTVDTGAPYLVMEFIHGRSLRALLEQGALPRKQIAVFLRQIASALRALHQSTIYHRDLKPENLMIRADADNEQQMVLIDFSIAIVKSPEQTFHGISRVAGTLDYMAPEQVIGYADASTDIYSLAKILMEMLTGLRWTELLPEATLDLPEQIRDYFAKRPGIFQPDSIDLIVSALAFDPVRRPKDVHEFSRPIARDLEGSS